MSKKVDENYFYDDEEEALEEEEEDRKCPPQLVPSSLNPDEEWAAVAQKDEAAAVEEAVLFDEEEEMIKRGTFGHVLESEPNKLSTSKDGRNTARRAFGGQADYSLGAEEPNMQEWHCPKASEEGQIQNQELVSPGAFREGGLDIEEGYGEDEFTVATEEENEEQSPVETREKSIDPVSAELVNSAEEERRLQEKIKQALESERQKAVVAEVAPAIDGDLSQNDTHRFGTRKRDWFVIGAILLIVVAITTTLAVTLTQDPSDLSNCGKDGYFGLNCDLYYPNCNVSRPGLIGDGVCDYQYNTTECGWEGGDCRPCDDGYFGPNCTLYYPNCNVSYPEYIGDGICDDGIDICMDDDCSLFIANTSECGWEGGDCLPCDPGYFGWNCDLYFPNCSVPIPESIGDFWCNGLPYNIEECGWDGGDCCNASYFGPNCDLYYPNCNVSLPEYIGDGSCDIGTQVCDENGCQVVMGNTEECGWDGGDCVHCDDGYFGPDCNITGYTNCSVDYPALIGNGICDGEPYDTEECGWDGGDCVHCNASYFGPNCTLYYPNCSVSSPELIGDGYCDDVYNTTECGWEGGDCIPCNTSYFGPNCTLYYPNCSVSSPELIGDGYCHDVYNTTECGWEGGDCIPCNDGYFGPNCDLYYPNCSVPFPESESIGDGFCDNMYNTTECGWEGGDCLPCDDGYFGFNCDLYYPNCSVPIPEWIGDGACDGLPYDVEECGWDGGDCPS